MNEMEKLEQLLGRMNDAQSKKMLAKAECEEIAGEVAAQRKRVAEVAGVTMVDNLKGLAKVIVEGDVAKEWSKVLDSLRVIKENDSAFFSQAGTRLKDVGDFTDEQRKFLVQLVGNCLCKADSLSDFLNYVSNAKRKDGNFFIGES